MATEPPSPGRVATELRRTGAGAFFVVRTDEPAFEQALRELAFAGSDGEFARRFPADAPGLDRIYRTFERCLEDVLEQTARRRPAPWEDALGELAARLERGWVEWFLTGSAALAVRGIDVAPRDVDVVTTDHRRVAESLADELLEPPLHDDDGGWVAAWFGRAFLGARVEWIADVRPDLDERAAPNEIGPAAAGRLERVRWNRRSLLASPLDLQLAVNEARGLGARVEAIRRFAASRAHDAG